MNELEAYIHEQAFSGFIRFCSGEEKMIELFESDTGLSIPIPRSPIEAMIDKATGSKREFVKQFIEWCADQYGREMLPDDLGVFMNDESRHE